AGRILVVVPRHARIPRVLERLAGLGPAGTAFLAAAGIVIAAAIVYADYPFEGEHEKAFTESGPYFLWLLLLCGQAGLWAALLPALARIVVGLRESWGRHRRTAIRWITGFAVLVALPGIASNVLGAPPADPIPRHE